MLVQGKFKIYLHYFTFKSSFNSRTLFGNSDIKVPKWDIIEIVRGKHLLSLMVTIVTVHGKLEFTSFITDPIDKLMQLYDNRTTAALLEQQKNCTELQRL